jgi:hypothetical protein
MLAGREEPCKVVLMVCVWFDWLALSRLFITKRVLVLWLTLYFKLLLLVMLLTLVLVLLSDGFLLCRFTLLNPLFIGASLCGLTRCLSRSLVL